MTDFDDQHQDPTQETVGQVMSEAKQNTLKGKSAKLKGGGAGDNPKQSKNSKRRAKQQRKIERVLALPAKQQPEALRNFWCEDIPKRFMALLGEDVIVQWKTLTNWQARQDKPKHLPVSMATWRSLEDNQMEEAVEAMNSAFLDLKSPLKIARDRVILDLFSDWMRSGNVLKVGSDDYSVDASTRALGTGVRPSLDIIPTLRTWLEMATGQNIATYISGYGMRAETWEERAHTEIEESMDDFLYDLLGDAMDDGDTESIAEMRVMAYDFPACFIGQVGFAGEDGSVYAMEPSGYLGWISGKSVEEFARTVDLDLLGEYPFMNAIYQSLMLQDRTAQVSRSCPSARL